MTTFYYLITSPERLSAKRKHDEKRAQVIKQADDFADIFLKPFQKARKYFDQRSGALKHLVFTPPMPEDTWFVPTDVIGWQQPRTQLKKVPGKPRHTTDEVKAHRQLLKEWQTHWPRIDAPIGDLLHALIGVDDNFMTAATFTQTATGDMLVSCSRPATVDDPGVIELLGSDYAARLKAAQEAAKAATGSDK